MEWWGWLAVALAGQFIGFLMCVLPDKRRGKAMPLDGDGREPIEIRAFAYGIPLRWTSTAPRSITTSYISQESGIHRGAA